MTESTRSVKRFFPKVILALSLLGVALCWALASPIGSTPDEDFHIGNSWCAFGESRDCELVNKSDGGYRWARIPFTVDACFRKGQEISASCISEKPPKFQVVPIDTASSLYPPQFYVVGHLFLKFSNKYGVLFFRIFNALLFIFLFSAAIRTSTPTIRKALIGTTLAFLVPQSIFLIASVNPSSWSVTGMITSWSFLATMLDQRENEGRLTRAVFVFWVVSTLVATSRHDSTVYVVVLSVVLCFQHFKLFRSNRHFLIGGLVVTVSTLVLSRNIIIYVCKRVVAMFSDSNFLSFARYWLIHFVEIPLTSMGLNYGSYGPTGTLDVLTPPLVGHIQFGLLVGLLLWGMRQRNTIQRRTLIFFVLVLFLIILQQVSRGRETGFYFVQGRYFLPFVASFVGIILATNRSSDSIFDFPSLRTPLISLLAISHSLALFSIIRRYSSGTTNDYKQFDIFVDKNFAMPSGWRFLPSISPQLIYITGSLAFTVAVWSLLTYFLDDSQTQRTSELRHA